MWTVYKHTSPNNKVYVGITSKPIVRRFGVHGQGYKSNRHFWNAINKYGWERFKHEVIADGLNFETACEMEKQLIREYKSYDSRYGYNIALGGQGNLMDEVAKKRISERLKNYYSKPENKEQVSKRSKKMWNDPEYHANHIGENHPMYGKSHSEESRKKIGETRKKRNIKPWNTGKHLKEETKEKISKALTGTHRTLSAEAKAHIAAAKCGERNPNYGKPMPDHVKEKLIKTNEKAVVQIVDGQFVRYDSIKKAGQETGVNATNILRVCKGERATAGGYVWKYA